MSLSAGRSAVRPLLRLVLFAFAFLLVVPAVPAEAAPSVSFTWTRPDRYVDTDGDGLPDPRNTEASINAPFTARMNACASSADGATISQYRWRSPGNAANVDTTNCRATLAFNGEGTFPVTLTIVTPSGQFSATQDVMIDDLLIISLGDSFASGEGIPHSYGLGNGLIPLPVNVKWQAEDDTGASRCHRSAYAGSALAAAWLEANDPKTSVTFVHLACSGAKIEDQQLWGDRARLGYFHEGGMLDPYRGVVPQSIGSTSEEPPQVDQAAAITGTRQVDAMTLSIGGNDLHFSNIIKDCLVGHASRLLQGDLRGCDVPESPTFDCGSAEGEGECAGVDTYNEQIARLPGRFDRLATRLSAEFGSRLDPSRVLLMEYPNPTRCDDGEVCPMLDPLISLRESRWADRVVLPGLNGVLEGAATANDWTYVGGISQRFEDAGRGYAADDSWFISLGRSFAQQAAKDGAFHPNKAGQRWYRSRILAQLGPVVAPGTPLPPANVGSDPWSGGPFDNMDLFTDRDGDLIPDLFDNCPSVGNIDQADDAQESNGAGGYIAKDGIGDACGLVADTNGGQDGATFDGKCDHDAPPDDQDNAPCSLSSVIEDHLVGGRVVFMNWGHHATSTSAHPVPRVETGLIIDGTATPLTNQSLTSGMIGAKVSAVGLPIPRCMAMLGRPCVQIEGDLQFFEAHGSEVTGVHVVGEDYGLEFWRTSAHIHGNWIGSVSTAGASDGPGLVLRESSVHVGGPEHWERNVISGNEDGVQVLYNGAQRNRIENNLIGTDAAGRRRIGNTGEGISITSSGPEILGNVIVGSGANGIAIGLSSDFGGQTRGAVITGNRIGINSRNAAMGSGRWGIRIDSSSGHTVGGPSAEDGNLIANNRLGGIQLQAGLGNRFNRNEIWDNGSPGSPGALGINLAHDLLDADVPTGNDPLDIDGQPGPPYNVSNNLQNFPTVISVTAEEGKTRINAALESRPNATYRLEFFASSGCEPQRHGEGERFLTAKSVATSTNGKTGLSFTLPEVLGLTEFVTATATSPSGDTSEFSPANSRRGPCTTTFTVNSTGDADDGDVSDGRCDTGTAWDGYTGICTLRAAITQANWLVGHDTIAFGIGSGARTITPATSLPWITDSLTMDATTQPGFAGSPLIRLDGGTSGWLGLQVVGAKGTTIRGLSLTGWNGTAISVREAPLTLSAGNYIGLLPNGSAMDGNGTGIYMTTSRDSTIGGTVPADRNVISGNEDGIWLSGTTGNQGVRIEGNRIGTNAAGTAARPNAGDGITVGSNGVLVGGSTASAGNLISGNGWDGLRVTARVTVLRNLIGTNAGGTGAIPNEGDGIQLATGPGATIGAASGDGNTIAFNRGNGIDGWAGTTIRRNAIHSNAGMGISLVPSGTPVLTPPQLTSVTRAGVVRGRVTGKSSRYAVEIFANPGSCDSTVEARTFRKAVTVTIPAGAKSATFRVDVGQLVGDVVLTATRTKLDDPAGGNTSQISNCQAP